MVARPGRPTLRLIVSADYVNADDSLAVVLALHVLDTDPGNLLAPRVGDHGWAWALSIEPIQRRRLVEQVGTAGTGAMEQVSNALRAVQDL